MTSRDLTFAQQLSATLFPPTEQLLVAGGDTRMALDPHTQKNLYGCTATPAPHVLAFGSATASTISAQAYLAADRLRQRIAHQLERDEAEQLYADEMQRIRQALTHLNGLDALHGLEVVLAASGTDTHRIAAHLLAEASPPLRVLMVASSETGRGVVAALGEQRPPVQIALRRADGSVRPVAEVDAEFERHAEQAIAQGERVLLTLVDVSKTGLIAPSVACALALHQRYPERIHVFVDACQYRLAPATLRAYLMHDFLVSITGSKFITGPGFSAALLIPERLSQRLSDVSLADLRDTSLRGEWPLHWRQAARLKATPNFGLLLRWEAALTEMRAFYAVSNLVAKHFLHRCAAAISQRLQDDAHFEMLAVAPLQRQPLVDDAGWDGVQTIFPFLLRDTRNGALLNSEQMQRVYLTIQSGPEPEVQLGQPVPCGTREGVDISALRLCMSARLIVEAIQHNGRDEALVIERALRALDQVAALAQSVSCVS